MPDQQEQQQVYVARIVSESEVAKSSDVAEVSPSDEAKIVTPEDRYWREIDTNRERDMIFLGISIFILIVAYVIEVTPAQDGVTLFNYKLPETCGSKIYLNSTCPGCGLTRSVVYSSRLDPRAWDLNRMGPIFFIVFVIQIPYRLWRLSWARQIIAKDEMTDSGRDYIKDSLLGRSIRYGLMIALTINWLVTLL